MDLAQAYRILHVEEKDTPLIIKRKYRRMMRRYHPDAAAARAAGHPGDSGEEDEYRRISQLLNEAYEFIKANPPKTPAEASGSRGKKDPEPAGDLNPSAFCERTVLWQTSVFFPDGRYAEHYKEGVRGRFCWDPDLEEFSSLLKSVNAETIRLMQDIEDRLGIYGEQDHPYPDMRAGFQVRIFHLLMQEFIRPLTCLKKLEEYVCVTDEALAFYLGGSLLVSGRENVLAAEELTRKYHEGKGAADAGCPKKNDGGPSGKCPLFWEMDKSRIRTGSCEFGFSGNLSFEDDSLYYIILPLLARGCADLEIYPKVMRPQKKNAGRTGILYVNLILTVRGEEEADRPGRGALMIASLLKEYEAAIRGIV